MELDLAQKEKIKRLAGKYQLKLMVLFGSQAKRKRVHKESDFDVAYLSKKDLSGKKIIDLNCDLMGFSKQIE